MTLSLGVVADTPHSAGKSFTHPLLPSFCITRIKDPNYCEYYHKRKKRQPITCDSVRDSVRSCSSRSL